MINSFNLEAEVRFERSLEREHLTYSVTPAANYLDELLYAVNNSEGASIIFTTTRAHAYHISQSLIEQGFDAEFFHAKLPTEEKEKKQKTWTQSSTQIMVATNAFGMGIDKSDVRTVFHLDLPSSIEAYVQEAGRAGRDGKPSHCILLLQPDAVEQSEKIFKSGLPNREEFGFIARMLYNHFEIGENERPENAYDLDLIKFIKKFKLNKKRTLKTLEFLEQHEIIFIKKLANYSLVQVHSNPNTQQVSKKLRYKVLEYLVRNHPGILSEEKSVSEFLIARELNKSTKKIRKILHELKEEGFLNYSDRSIKKIQFIRPRETNFIQNNLWHEFEKIQGSHWKRLQEMIYYSIQTEICREKLLLRYFGNKSAGNCGKCDVCQNKIPIIEADSLLDFLKDSPKTIRQILAHFITSPKESVLAALQELSDENLIEAVGLDAYQKK